MPSHTTVCGPKSFGSISILLLLLLLFMSSPLAEAARIRRVPQIPQVVSERSVNDIESRSPHMPPSLHSRATGFFTLSQSPSCVQYNYLVDSNTYDFLGVDGSALYKEIYDPNLESCVVKPTPDLYVANWTLAEVRLNETRIKTDCFCKLNVPLRSFWGGCIGMDWIETEDWFDKTCPSRKNDYGAGTVPFDKAPKCGKQCLQRSLMNNNCISERRDCFCFWGSLFDCDKECNSKKAQELWKWRNDTCRDIKKVDWGALEEHLSSTSFLNHGRMKAQLHRNAKPLTWYEIFSISVLAASALVLLGFVIWEVFGNHHRRERKINEAKVLIEKCGQSPSQTDSPVTAVPQNGQSLSQQP